MGLAVVGVASTIDNDLAGSEITIGVDTALNIALESIDRLKVTASSHQRAFLVEVMGRNCGYLALMAGIAGGAESVVIPEAEVEPEVLARDIQSAYAARQGARAGGGRRGRAQQRHPPGEHFEAHKDQLGFDLRVTTLGHVQRGGTPSAFDRLLATRLAAAAIDHLDRGEHGRLIGLLRGEVASTPLTEVVGRPKLIDLEPAQAAEGARPVIVAAQRAAGVAARERRRHPRRPCCSTSRSPARYGLWDPWETHYSEVARQMTHRGRLHQPVVAGLAARSRRLLVEAGAVVLADEPGDARRGHRPAGRVARARWRSGTRPSGRCACRSA